jgi:hypothetical protein
MYRCLSVVALVLLVLTGAMGLRNIAGANPATFSASGVSAPSIWSNGPGPIPDGPGNVKANGPGPIPDGPGAKLRN